MKRIDKLWTEKLFKELEKHSDVPDSEKEKILPMLSTININKNEYLIHEGDTPDKMSFIVSGIFRAYYTTEKADERVIVFRGENCFLTAFTSYLENIPSALSLQALEDSLLLYISLEDYKTLMDDHICWQSITAQITRNIFIEKEKREREFLSDDAHTRYTNFIKRYSEIEGRISQYHIASYLGISPVSLSRIKNSCPNTD